MPTVNFLDLGPEIKQLYEQQEDTNVFTDADKEKLDGAATDSQLTELAQNIEGLDENVTVLAQSVTSQGEGLSNLANTVNDQDQEITTLAQTVTNQGQDIAKKVSSDTENYPGSLQITNTVYCTQEQYNSYATAVPLADDFNTTKFEIIEE